MNPSPATARRWVLLSVFALVGISIYRGKLTTDEVSLSKRIWGVWVVGMMLAVLADVAPSVAGPFALLTVAGSLTTGGDAAVQNFLGKLSGTGSTSTAAQAAVATAASNAAGTSPGVQVPSPSSPGTNP